LEKQIFPPNIVAAPKAVALNFDQILLELKQKKYRPVYFLYGKEPYFIDTITDYIEKNVLTEPERAFNQTVLYGKEVDHLAVIDTARRYPMGASHQVVIIKEAQEMQQLKDLQSYIEKPLESTILVIAYKHKQINLNTKFGKALKKHALVFQSRPLYDNQVPDWIHSYLKRKKLEISPGAGSLIAEYLGTELGKVANELNKLAINLEPGTEVSEKHIEAYIGISKDYNIFELQRALAGRDILKANRIVNYFAANPKNNPMPVVLGSLYNYFSKVYMLHFLKNTPEQELLQTLGLRSGYFLREYRQAARTFPRGKTEQVIALLKEYDLKSKGVGYNSTGKPEGALLKEMVYRILH
jgi:DNA polymerase-3 subunit delta